MITNDKTTKFGGVIAKNLNQIDKKWICVLCTLILLKPHQLLCCGALLCEWCCKNNLSNNEPFTCPFCKTSQIKKEAKPDRGTGRDLNNIRTECNYCSWTGIYKDYLVHLQNEHANLECVDCQERFFSVNSFEEHRQDLCVHRRIPCGLPDCESSVKWNEMEMHYLTDKHQQRLTQTTAEFLKPRDPQLQIQEHLETMSNETDDINESINMTTVAYETLTNDSTRLDAEKNQIKTNLEQTIPKIEVVKKQGNENENHVKELLNQLNRMQTDVDSIKRTADEGQILVLDTNGTVTFRFTQPTTPTFSFTSSKFKTSEYGYIFMLRVCSTSISGIEYVSLFLTLCNGEYSNLIPYPFVYKIYLILWDQSGQEKHIKRVIKPDPNSSSVSRPTSEMNDEFGASQFCPVGYLTDDTSVYIKDAMFFIRIFVDFLDDGKVPFHIKDDTHESETAMVTE